MLKNILRTALRSLSRDLGVTAINLLGLTAALVAILVIFLFIRHEWSYDQFHEHSGRIFRITFDETYGRADGRHLATTAPPLAEALRREVPGVKNAVRLRYADEVVLEYRDRQFYESKLIYADSGFFDLFTFPLAAGDPATALAEPNSIVLTPGLSEKYFGDTSPIGQTLQLEGSRPLKVTGILAEQPDHSHLDFAGLISFSTFQVPPGYPVTLDSWAWVSFHTYILLEDITSPEAVAGQLPEFMENHYSAERAETVRLRLQPVEDAYFHSGSLMNTQENRSGNISYTYGLAAIALLLLLIACFNFLNLATARSVRRGKEVGIRKVLGATTGNVRNQFLGEAVLLSLFSLTLSLFIFEIFKNDLSTLLGWSLSLRGTDYLWLLPGMVGLAVLVALGAGFYPAMVLSRFSPGKILMGHLPGSPSGQRLRTWLVGLQFAITAGLIAASLIVQQQMEYIRHRSLGFDKEHLVALQMRTPDFLNRFDRARQILRQNPSVQSVTAGDIFNGDYGSVPIFPQGADERENVPAMHLFGIYFDYLETAGIRLVEGRGITRDFPRDTATGILLNEAAVRTFGWEDPIGKQLRIGDIKEGEVIGVVEDFHYNSLHDPVKPMVLFHPRTTMAYVVVRLHPGDIQESLASLRQDWERIAPELPFQLSFIDEQIDARYRADRRFSRLVWLFTLLIILLGSAGLYGLVTIMVRYRLREISIRKVLGATLADLTLLLTKPFIGLLLLGNFTALPLAWWAAGQWLQQFAYRTDTSLLLFLLAAMLTLVLALLSAGTQAMRAAAVNPAEILKKE